MLSGVHSFLKIRDKESKQKKSVLKSCYSGSFVQTEIPFKQQLVAKP